MTRKTTHHTTQGYLDSLEWHMMPEHGGQIVAVRYAADYDGIWEWCYDQSDQTSSYEFLPYDGRASERNMRFEPWNGRLPSCNKPRKVKTE